MVIYQITNLLNNDFYIGKTVNIEKRFYNHKYNTLYKNSQTYIHRAMRKYGVNNFSITILEEIDSKESLNIREMYWIDLLKPKYNMTKGGDGGDTSKSPNFIYYIKHRDVSGTKNPMYGRKRPDAINFFNDCREKTLESVRCPVSCEGIIYNSVSGAQTAYPGISIRKRLDNEKYPDFYRLRPKTKRK